MTEEIKNAKALNLLGETTMMDDPLFFLVYPLHFNLKHRVILINIIKGFIAIYLQMFNVIGLVYICKDETGTYFKQYISFILGQQVGISSYMLHIYYIRNIFQMSDLIKLSFLPLDVADGEMQQRILRQCTFIRKLNPLLLFITYIGAAFITLPKISDSTDRQFTVMFIRKYMVWPIFFLGLYHVCLLSIVYSISCVCAACIYLTTHLKFQFYLLSAYLKQISDGLDDSEAIHEDSFYQEVIYKRLRSFVQAHNKIKSSSVLFLEVGKWAVLVTASSTTLMYTALAYFLTLEDNFIEQLLCVCCIGLVATFTIITIRCGQQMQDGSTNLYRVACDCKWDLWNVQNRKTLQMIMINTSKEVTLTSFGILDLDNVIMLKMLKVTYSMALFFLNANK